MTRVTLLACVGLLLTACGAPSPSGRTITGRAAGDRAEAAREAAESTRAVRDSIPPALRARPLGSPASARTMGRAIVTLEPACAGRGETIAIVVVGEARGAVVWQAIYAQTESHDAAALRDGYGGYGRGYAGADGIYRGTLVVSARAPFGAGHVDAVSMRSNRWAKGRGTFTVAPAGSCPP